MTYFTGICLQKMASHQKGFSPKMTSPLKIMSPQKMAFSRNFFGGSRILLLCSVYYIFVLTCSILFKGVQTAGQVDTHISVSVPVSSPSIWWSVNLCINCVTKIWAQSCLGDRPGKTFPPRGNEDAAASSFPLGLNGLRACRALRLDGLN